MVNLLEVKEERLLYEVLQTFIENLYFRYLAINPKERKVVIVEPLFCPLLFKKVLFKVFFTYFTVSCVRRRPAEDF